MPQVYAATKKGRLEEMLRQSGESFTKQEMIKAMADQGVMISRSSVNSAVEEWEMNNWLTKDAAGKYSWKSSP